MKRIARGLCPPIIWNALVKARQLLRNPRKLVSAPPVPGEQDLAVYSDPEMAQMLETWGEGTVWSEIQLLLAMCRGRVLDIACGTGKTMQILARFPNLDIHGFDISEPLLRKAIGRGIDPSRIQLSDATRMPYGNMEFDYGYSIGSLEHFTEQGISDFLRECKRVVSGTCFHQIPVSNDSCNHGWIKTQQSYYNNSEAWWLEKFHAVYSEVLVLPSGWHDDRSNGAWFVCKQNHLVLSADQDQPASSASGNSRSATLPAAAERA